MMCFVVFSNLFHVTYTWTCSVGCFQHIRKWIWNYKVGPPVISWFIKPIDYTLLKMAHRNSWFTLIKWWFSIAFCYQRVVPIVVSTINHRIHPVTPTQLSFGGRHGIYHKAENSASYVDPILWLPTSQVSSGMCLSGHRNLECAAALRKKPGHLADTRPGKRYHITNWKDPPFSSVNPLFRLGHFQ